MRPLEMSLMTPEKRQMKGRPHFLPMGLKAIHHRSGQTHFHVGTSGKDWLNKEAMGVPPVERLSGRTNVEGIEGKFSEEGQEGHGHLGCGAGLTLSWAAWPTMILKYISPGRSTATLSLPSPPIPLVTLDYPQHPPN